MKLLKIILVFLITALISGLAFTAFAYRHAYYGLRSKFSRFEQQYQAERTLLSQRSALWHGEIVSTDIANNQFTISLKDQVLASTEDVNLLIQVTETTLFVKQNLIASDGAYVGFSETASGSLTDIVPGMRIAVSFHRDVEAGRMIADSVMFGGAL